MDPFLSDSKISPLSGSASVLSSITSSKLPSSSCEKGASTETCLPDTLMVSSTSPALISKHSATSSGEGSRSYFCSKEDCAPRDFVQRTHLVQRQPHDARLLGQCLQNGLANPPDCIRNKLETACFIKTLRCLDKTQVPFVYQIVQRQALILILLRYRHHKTPSSPS